MTTQIQFTETAKAHFKHQLNAHPEAIGIRLSVKKAGCSGLMYVTEVKNIFEAEDRIILDEPGLRFAVDPKALPYLNGMMVDVVKKPLGQSQVVYRNPNEKARCGCGESFMVQNKNSDIS
ncbi:MAG: iron-sulfur cluster assembly accessory protein [Gammaproteobacteria bacterium]|nr:iron-sulfur cluster assembly accessory protein [Gammaproteobacteria bacterium]